MLERPHRETTERQRCMRNSSSSTCQLFKCSWIKYQMFQWISLSNPLSSERQHKKNVLFCGTEFEVVCYAVLDNGTLNSRCLWDNEKVPDRASQVNMYIQNEGPMLETVIYNLLASETMAWLRLPIMRIKNKERW